MATSKTLTPTNVTIYIPEFTDQPDQRVNSNCIDKEADAINALKTKTDTLDTAKVNVKGLALTNNATTTFTFPNNTPFMLQIYRANSTGDGYNGLYIGQAHSSGSVKAVTESSVATVTISGKTLSIAVTNTTNMNARIYAGAALE